MNISIGAGITKYGPGVNIELDGNEVVTAIDAYLVAHGVFVSGPRTVRVNDTLVLDGTVYVDPSGFVISNGNQYLGSGGIKTSGREK